MRILIAVLLLIATARPVHSDEEQRSMIVENVQEIALPGVVGSLSVFSEDAFPIVAAPVEDSKFSPVIAAAPLGQGRIVALGHNGYMSPEIMKNGQTGLLMSNLMLWSADLKKTQSGRLRIGVVGNNNLVKALQAAKLSAKELNRNWPHATSGLNVIMVDPRSIEKEDVSHVVEYVKSGGGLIMGTAGWIWHGYTRKEGENLIDDFAGNLIAAEAGIAWDSNTVPSPPSKMIPVPDELPQGLNAIEATELLLAGSADTSTQQCVATISRTIQSISAMDQVFLPGLQKSLAQKLGKTIIPGPRNQVREKDTLARLQVALNTRLALGQQVDKLTASPLAEEFPKQPPASAKTVSRSFSINTNQPRWHSLGLYARAGEVITVKIPHSATSAGLSLRIGAHKDQLWHKDSWSRAPEVTKTFALNEQSVQAGTAFGGLVYVVVPKDCSLGTLRVEVDGAVESPLFVLGKTSQREWLRQRKLPCPWAELASDRFIITLPTEAITNLGNPDELMSYWNRVLDTCADLAMISPQRSSPERFVIDVQISAGYMHAGYPIMAPLNLAKEVTDLETLQAKGNWGVYHEIGHNHQEREWTWDGLGEVTVNLFSMYVLDTINPGAPHHGMVQPAKRDLLTSEFEKTGKLEGPWPQLMPYIELKNQFGWQPFKTVFAQYQELPESERPKTLQEKKDTWLILFSRAVGKDLSGFYDYWKLGCSEEAKRKVADLPAWDRPNS